MFNKILIANRGEIAIRIIHTCKRMGIKTVAVYAEVDARSPYVQEADEAAFIGAAQAKESFLNPRKIIAVALRHGAQAIHPGYGFLSENPEFAQMTIDAGLTFIGPPPSAIAKLGNKTASKALAIDIGAPVTPGNPQPFTDPKIAAGFAEEIGYPILLKPAAGGGGRGMRIVESPEELPGALEQCMDETRKAFGDDHIFMERFITRPRHIEFQVLADQYGSVIHLGERECSVQRRYQKVIEESPSMAITPDLRERMGETACKLAQAAGYVNAGTVEFILDQDKNYYFLEMNTRLQVEHPVTELVTGLDMVELQLRIADGEPLPYKQYDISLKGWAIEARICAEDPYRGFLPTTGMITRYAMPRGDQIRVDSGIDAGSLVTIYYDSLLAKVCAWGETRGKAINTLIKALNGYHIEGVLTNVDFTNAVLNHPAFQQGELSTNFIDEYFEDGESKVLPPQEQLHFMVIAVALVFHSRRTLVRDSLKPMRPLVGSTQDTAAHTNYMVRVGEQVFHVDLAGDFVSREWEIQVDGRAYAVVTPDFEYYRRRLQLKINGVQNMFRLQYQQNHIRCFFCGTVRTFEIYTTTEWRLAHYMKRESVRALENVLRCPMPGLVTAICVEKGAQVRRGQELIRMESMKMESGVGSPCDAEVESVLVAPGQAVDTDEPLITFVRESCRFAEEK